MLLEPPDPVVAHHADDADAVARERVPLHPGEAERAVAEQQHDLALGPRELGRERVARPAAEAAERARVQPAARLVGLDRAAGVGGEVAAVADHDRVAVEHLAELRVHAQRVQRRARVGELLALAGALLLLHRAQVLGPRPASSRRPRRRRRACAACRRGRRRARPRPGAGARARARRRRARSARSPSPNDWPKPSRKSIGTPITSATSAPFSPALRAREKKSG